ncbi:hypothetical protein BH20BAC1_BH20BAC1_12960 [soil metagenome]
MFAYFITIKPEPHHETSQMVKELVELSYR